ncbi:MAG: hypothetical protein ACTHJ5_04390 [Ilyomonas sp.]
MSIYSLVFNYHNTTYHFTAKYLGNDLYKVLFLNSVDREFLIPQKFIINANHTLIFLPEEPNAVFYVSLNALDFLKSLAASLKEYFMEYV